LFAHKEAGRRQRPVAALAILFGLLLGFSGPAGARLGADPGAARIGHGDGSRPTFNLRTTRCDDEPAEDRAAPVLLLAAPPQIVTEHGALRPAADGGSIPASFAPADRHFAYFARAPPAA